MEHLAECVTPAKFDATATVTIRCFRNELMTREYAQALYELMTREYAQALYGLITKEYGVPRLRVVDPTPDAAAYFFDLCADEPESVHILSGHGTGRTRQAKFETLGVRTPNPSRG